MYICIVPRGQDEVLWVEIGLINNWSLSSRRDISNEDGEDEAGLVIKSLYEE